MFVTTDPSRDTPERLGEWLRSFPGDVVGLTGSAAELEAAQKAAGVTAAIAEAPDANGQVHGRATPRRSWPTRPTTRST